jgi:hypothetical protein
VQLSRSRAPPCFVSSSFTLCPRDLLGNSCVHPLGRAVMYCTCAHLSLNRLMDRGREKGRFYLFVLFRISVYSLSPRRLTPCRTHQTGSETPGHPGHPGSDRQPRSLRSPVVAKKKKESSSFPLQPTKQTLQWKSRRRKNRKCVSVNFAMLNAIEKRQHCALHTRQGGTLTLPYPKCTEQCMSMSKDFKSQCGERKARGHCGAHTCKGGQGRDDHGVCGL